MDVTNLKKHNKNWGDGVPHWFSWLMPLTIAIALLSIGRIYLPIQKSPAELMKNVRMFIEKNEPASALREAIELLKLFPNNHIYLHQAAKLASQLNEHVESAKYFERFLLSSPNPSEACPEITHAYWKARNQEKMLDSANRCLILEPTNSDFIFELALATERAEKLDSALEQYKSGITLFPTYGDFAIGHARVLLRLGKSEQAWQEISAYIKAKPGVADAEFIAGLAAERTNQKDRAREIFEKALKNHPDNSEIKDEYKNFLKRKGSK